MLPTAALLFSLALPAAEPGSEQIKVEFRWLETKFVDGLTEKKGGPISCGGDDYFPHLKPILTAADVTGHKRGEVFFAGGLQHYLNFTLSKQAVENLTTDCGDGPGRWVIAFADGRAFGASYFDPKQPNKFSPPTVGFSTDKAFIDRVEAGVK